MKRTGIILLVCILSVSAVGCGQNADTAVPMAIPQAIMEDTAAYNIIFDTPPDTLARDAARPFEPTDIFQMHCFDHENKAMYTESQRAHVTVLFPSFLSYERNNEEEMNRDFNSISVFTQNGLETIGWKSPHGFEGGVPPEGFDSESVYCRDIDGNPTLGDLLLGGCDDPMYCISNPLWEEYIINCNIDAVLTGSRCTASDAWAATSVCFCEYCMEGFREYLKATMTDKQLLLWGVEDIETFDYADFIRENCYDQYLATYTGAGIDASIPLAQEYDTFQYLEITALQKRIQAEIQRANEVYGADVLVGANMADLNNQFMACADTVDFFAPELNLPYDPYPREAIRYELANAFGTILTGHPNSVQASDLMLSEASTQTHKIFTAEAYAHGGFLQIPDRSPFRDSAEIKIYETDTMAVADMEELYPYYDFIHDNGLFFEQLWPMAEVGVVYSFASNYPGIVSNSCFFGLSQSLISRNIPFCIIATGDGQMITKGLSEEDLDGLKLVVLPRVTHISESDREVLHQFIAGGGQVLSVNATALYDERGDTLEDSFTALDFDDVSADGYTHVPGHYEWDEEGFWEVTWTEPGDIEQVVNAVRDRITLPYEIADDDIVVTQYYSTYFNGYLYHLVNYGYDKEAEKIVQKKAVRMNLRDDTPFDPADVGVYYATPESGEIVPLDFTEVDGIIEVDIPDIVAWGTVMLGEKSGIEDAIKTNNAKLLTKDADRIAALTAYAEHVQATAGEIGLNACQVAPEVTEPVERVNEAPNDTDRFIYAVRKEGAAQMLALLPEGYAEIFDELPDYIQIGISKEGEVRYHIPYDDAQEAYAVQANAASLRGMEFVENNGLLSAKKGETTIDVRNQDNGETHIGIVLSGSSGERVFDLVAGIYDSLSSVWGLPELYDLTDPEYTLVCAEGSSIEKLKINWTIGDDDTYQRAKEYYRNALISSYVTFAGEEAGSTVYQAHIVEYEVPFLFRFNDDEKSIEFEISIKKEMER